MARDDVGAVAPLEIVDHYQHTEFWGGRLEVRVDPETRWCVLEKHPDEHDGSSWFVPIGPMSSAFMTSARISNACVEGSVEDMRGMCRAILDGAKSFERRRCGFYVDWSDEIVIHSPRNSTYGGLVMREQLEDAARRFLERIDVREHPECEIPEVRDAP